MTRRIIPHTTAEVLDPVVLEIGEIAYDETNDQLRVGDGATAGGLALAVASATAVNAAATDLATTTALVNQLRAALIANGIVV